MRLGAAEIRFTDVSDGDFSPPETTDDAALAARRRAVVDAPWTWLRQEHRSRVVTVHTPGAHAGDTADAAVVVVKNAPVAVVTADCAPVVLVDDSGASLAVVHAGWRGLVDGVVDGAVATMRARNREAETISAALGPCIRPECYEFSPADLDNIEGELGATVRGVTSDGKPALDMPAAVRAVLARNDVVLAHDEGACTAHTPGYWSHRARADAQRQATVAWLT